MIHPRVLFSGDPAAATPWVGIAKKLARECYSLKIANKVYQLGSGVKIRVENIFPIAGKLKGISKVWIEAQQVTGGFVVLPSDNDHPTGVHAVNADQYYILPIDNIDPVNQNLLDTFQGKRIYSGNPNDSILTKHEVYKRFGNQYFFDGPNVYSWWFSPYGDGPISLTEEGLNSDLVNKVDPFSYRPYYAGGTGFVYLAGVVNGNVVTGDRYDVPLVIYRNGKVLDFIDVSVAYLIPGFEYGSLIINGFGRCSYDGKVRSLVSLLNIYSFGTNETGNIVFFEAQVVLLAYEGTQLLEVSYVTPANINPPSDSDYFSICTWPWRFNSTGTECASITLEYKKTDVGYGNYFIRVVRVPLSHTINGISVGTAIIDLYPVVSSEIIRDEGTEFQETTITYIDYPEPGLPDGRYTTIVNHIDTKYGTEYEHAVTDIPIAVDYDEEDNIIFTLLSITSPAGTYNHRFQDYNLASSTTYSYVTIGGIKRLKYITETESSYDRNQVYKYEATGAVTLSVNGLVINLWENCDQIDAPNSESGSRYSYLDSLDPINQVDNASIETAIKQTSYSSAPCTIIGYLSTKTKTVFVIGQSLSVRDIYDYSSDYTHFFEWPDIIRTATGTEYKYVGFTSEIRYILYVNGTLIFNDIDLESPDATESTDPVVWPGNWKALGPELFYEDRNNVYNNTVTVEDKRGLLPIMNLFSSRYSYYPYTESSYSDAAVNFVADFRKPDKIAWLLSIEQQPNPEELEDVEGRAIVKASFDDDPLGLLGHVGTTTRFSTIGLC